MMYKQKQIVVFLCVILVITLLPVSNQVSAETSVLDSSWTIVIGTDSLEATAGNDLKQFLQEKFQIAVSGPVEASQYSGSSKAIYIGTPLDHSVIQAEHQSNPFQIDMNNKESYYLAYRTDGTHENLWITGAGAKGAMNGTFRFEDRQSLQLQGLNEQGAPAFANRIAGHLMVQAPPADWSEDDQASYYAHNYINVVWGEKYGPPISYQTRQKWGLGLALEVRLPPVSDAWKNDSANASAVYWRDSWSGKRKVVSPFDPVGRQAYLDAFEQAILDNPDTKILYSLFGDYSFTTDESSTRVSDGSPCGCTHEDSIKEVMSIMKEAIGSRDIVPAVWMWHLYPDGGDEAFMEELRDLGYGIIYNEASNSDDWMYKRNNFNQLALKTDQNGKSKFGDDYMVLVSAGGTGESVDPVIGLPFPHVAAYKIRKLYDAGIENFLLWWGSGEGWSYSANMSVIREMIWNPQLFNPSLSQPFDPSNPDPLLEKVAVQDFGSSLASQVMEFWESFDDAVINGTPSGATSGIQIFSWNQRLGVFTLPHVFGGGYPEPLIPSVLSNKDRFNIYYPWGIQQSTIDNFGLAVQQMDAALEKAWNLRMSVGDSDPELKQMHLSGALFKRIFASQYHMLQALQITESYRGADGSIDESSTAWRADLEPIVMQEIENTLKTIDILKQLPANFTISGSSRDAFNNNGDRDKEIAMLQGKAASMQIWLNDLRNLALGQPVTASSTISSDRLPENAVDGNLETLWHSSYADNEWIYTDLGESKPLTYVKVAWNPNASAESYAIQVSEDPAMTGWTTAQTISLSTGNTDLVTLPEGTSARYVRVLGIDRASIYGFAINEIEIYGTEVNSSSASEIRYELESQTYTTSGDSVIVFNDASMSGGQGSKFNANGTGDEVTYQIDLPEDGSYQVYVGAKTQDSRGIAQLSIGGWPQGEELDFYSSTDQYVRLDLGSKTFNTTGLKNFTFTISGKNASSLGYSQGLDYIELVQIQ